MSWWLLGAGTHVQLLGEKNMYPWSSLYYHAILLTFYELRGCHKKKKKNVHKAQQLKKWWRKELQTVKFSTDNNTDVSFLITCHVKWVWKRTPKTLLSIMQTLGGLSREMKSNKATCVTLGVFMCTKWWFCLPGWWDTFFFQPFNCCSRNLLNGKHHTRPVDPSAQNGTICKHDTLNLHCWILPTKRSIQRKA